MLISTDEKATLLWVEEKPLENKTVVHLVYVKEIA